MKILQINNRKHVIQIHILCLCYILSYSCTTKKLDCRKLITIEFKEDLRKLNRDENYTILFLSYNYKFKIEDLVAFKDSILITKKIVEGEYDNPQYNPRRVIVELRKSEVNIITVVYRGICYELVLKKEFDNYIVEYDKENKKFSAIANNQEFLTFE